MRKLQTTPGGTAAKSPVRAAQPPAEAEEIADYLADVARQLAELAAEARLDRVGYLLSLAAREATLSRPRRARRSVDRP